MKHFSICSEADLDVQLLFLQVNYDPLNQLVQQAGARYGGANSVECIADRSLQAAEYCQICRHCRMLVMCQDLSVLQMLLHGMGML